MNMANSHPDDSNMDYGNELEFDYRANFTRRPAKAKTTRTNKIQYSRRGSSPVSASHNGIHRRRNKRFSW